MYKCEYCKKVLSCTGALNTHLKSAQYCIKLRNITDTEIFKCSWCEKVCSTKYRLKTHQKTACKIIKNNQLEEYKKSGIDQQVENEQLKIQVEELRSTIRSLELDQQNQYQTIQSSDFVKDLVEKHATQMETQLEKQAVKYETRLRDQEFHYIEHLDKLEARLESVAIKAIETPTTTTHVNNNNVNNYIAQMENVTEDRFQKYTQFLTHEYIKKGINGYVEYALDYPLNNRIVCVDLARKKIKYKDHDGNLVTDPNMEILGKQLFKSIQNRNEELNKEQIEHLKKEREEKKCDPGDGAEEYLDARCKINETRAFVKHSASGKISEKPSYKNFVKKICEKTYIN